ncbi:MAG: M20 family metallopeptidase [Candidatus Scatosoma sp.]
MNAEKNGKNTAKNGKIAAETALAKEFLNGAQTLRDALTECRRTLHKNAGTGFNIGDTVKIVKAELEKAGIEPQDCGKNGIVALIGGKKKGKTFLLRADMDALPMREETGLPFAAENGNMHACGHDMHTAMLLGAARILKSREEQLNGTVKLMFQPAEEIFCGSKEMIESGVLKNPAPDAAMMIHVMTGTPIPTGEAVVSAPGVSAPGADYFEITVRGKGCHGSMPNTGIDPITAAAHTVIALQELHSRELALNERAVLTVGQINGGNAANVIPETVVLGGTLRTYDEETRKRLKQRIGEIASGVAGAFRANAETVFGNGCPSLFNDERLCADAAKYVKELLGEKGAAAQPGANGEIKSAGSEDFAYISRKTPSVMIALGAGSLEEGYAYPQHHPKACFNEDALPVGCALYAYIAARWLQEHP